MIRTVIIVILALLGIFVHPFAPGTMDFVYRFIIFSVLTYLVYMNWRSSEEEIVDSIPRQTTVAKPAISDLPLELYNSQDFVNLLHNDARTQEFLLAQFRIMQSVLIAENGWIFYKKDSIVIEKIHFEKFSDPETTVVGDEFPISGIMQILNEDDRILIENNIKEKQGLFNYYAGSEYSPASFLGLPVDIQEGVRLFMVFDSHNSDHFNPDDKIMLDMIRQNTRIFLLNRMKAFDLLKNLKEKNRLLSFATSLNGCKTVSVAMGKLAELISREYEATRMTICTKKPESTAAVIRRVIGQKDDFDENFEFPLDQGLSGWVIDKNKPYLIDDMEKGEYFIPRYTKDEKTNFGLRSFLGVPIQAGEKVFGGLTLEHALPGKYTKQDLENIENIVTIFSTTFLRQVS